MGKNSSVIHHRSFPRSSGHFGVLELTSVFFLLCLNVSVDLARLVSLMGLFFILNQMMACFTGSDISFDFILKVNNNRFHMQMQHMKSPLDVLSVYL